MEDPQQQAVDSEGKGICLQEFWFPTSWVGLWLPKGRAAMEDPADASEGESLCVQALFLLPLTGSGLSGSTLGA